MTLFLFTWTECDDNTHIIYRHGRAFDAEVSLRAVILHLYVILHMYLKIPSSLEYFLCVVVQSSVVEINIVGILE